MSTAVFSVHFRNPSMLGVNGPIGHEQASGWGFQSVRRAMARGWGIRAMGHQGDEASGR